MSSPLPTAQIHMLCQFAETFGTTVPRPLRLHLLSRIRREPVTTTNGWTEKAYRDTARFLRDAREQPERVSRMLRRAAAELAPDAAQVAAAVERMPVAEHADTRDQVLSYLERIGEAGVGSRFAAGDSGLLLCSLHPEATRREVLTEHLRGRGMDQFRSFLSPKMPPLESLPIEMVMQFEKSSVETWLELCRICERVPQETRSRFPGIGWGWFAAAATIREPKNGKWTTPTLAEIERRLAVVCDNEGTFRVPSDLRKWVRSGGEMPDQVASKPDLKAEALSVFRANFHELDSINAAWEATFGEGAPYRARRPK